MYNRKRAWKVSFVYKLQFETAYVDIAEPFANYQEALDYQMLIYDSNEMWTNKNIAVVVRQTTVPVPSDDILV